MVSKQMLELGSKRSCIRELFEFGRQRATQVGRENVYDFSIGNPSVPAPKEVDEAIRDILNTQDPVAIHGYTSAPGNDTVRDVVADSLNRRFGTAFTRRNVYITCGAAAALTACCKSFVINSSSEFIAFAPYFPEYKCFAEMAGGILKVVPANTETFQINFDAFEKAISKNTQAVIVNSPNNPSGVVYTEETILRLSELLRKKSAEYGHVIYLMADEPYRELVYGGAEVPFIPNYYANTIVCYSYSKVLSLPGERIGYVLIPSETENFEDVFNAIAGSARAMGYVCAPALMQQVIARCVDVKPDLAVYEKNRNLLYDSLTKMGYLCAKPDGAFYLFLQAPDGDAQGFSTKAKEMNILIVPGDDFGCPDYLRISYCVETSVIEKALPFFETLIAQFRN